MKRLTLISGIAFALLISLSFLFKHVTADSKPRHPGAEGYSKMLDQQINQMKMKRGKDYTPRTKHLLPDGEAKYTNRLFLESSPYLLQHAHNPVNWFPWGEEAFQESKRLNRPIFISIGYSTCHWCHVMEEESFEDEEVAGFLNSHFIPIKVDREERPDVDSIYMAAAQIINGNGGWPLNVWLTPDLKPFYAGTYFPPRDGDRGAATGFLTILEKLSETYRSQPELILKSSDQLTHYIQKALVPEPGGALPDLSLADQALATYANVYDPEYGGILGAPKFPSSLNARLLFRQYKRKQEKKALEIATHSLEKMADGGMYDHVGGGFHRYSTDRMWLAPHFEKMLYDNALLAITYLEAWQVTKKDRFRIITKEILDYVQKEMTSENGAFYSATDADTMTPAGEKEEGYFFTWIPEELEEVLDSEKNRIIKAYFSIGATPNFEGRYILHITKSKTEVAATLNISVGTLEKEIHEAKALLYKARSKRKEPFTDTKILTSWNGLMISAFARAGLLLNEPNYTQAAINAAQLISDKLYINGKLFRSYKDDQAKYMAYLDDYAFLSASFIDLYEATSDIEWLKKTIELDSVLERFFEDPENGGFFMTSSEHEHLLAREKPTQDGALPSGNSVATLNLLRLYSFTTKTTYLNRAEKALKAISEKSSPLAISEMILALDYYHDLPKEIIIVTPEGKSEDAEPYLNELRKHYIPNRVLSVTSEGEHLKRHAKVIPLVSKKVAINGKTVAYLCEKGVCQLPSRTPEDFSKIIGDI